MNEDHERLLDEHARALLRSSAAARGVIDTLLEEHEQRSASRRRTIDRLFGATLSAAVLAVGYAICRSG